MQGWRFGSSGRAPASKYEALSTRGRGGGDTHMWCHVFNSNCARVRSRNIEVRPARTKAQDLIWKIKTKVKRAGGVAQVLEHLPSSVQGPEFKPHYTPQKDIGISLSQSILWPIQLKINTLGGYTLVYLQLII
jgi:hypothetical protein